MRLARLLADPWTIGAGGFIGALATVGLGLPVRRSRRAALGGYAVGTAVKALTSRDDDPRPPARSSCRRRGTDARELYERAREAAVELGEIARSQPAGPVQVQAADVHSRAVDTLEEIARLAGQTVVLARALGRASTSSRRAATVPHLQQESRTPASEAALEAVESQLAVFGRLEGAWRETHARLRAAALGLESLVASLAEVVALAQHLRRGPDRHPHPRPGREPRRPAPGPGRGRAGVAPRAVGRMSDDLVPRAVRALAGGHDATRVLESLARLLVPEAVHWCLADVLQPPDLVTRVVALGEAGPLVLPPEMGPVRARRSSAQAVGALARLRDAPGHRLRLQPDQLRVLALSDDQRLRARPSWRCRWAAPTSSSSG